MHKSYWNPGPREGARMKETEDNNLDALRVFASESKERHGSPGVAQTKWKEATGPEVGPGSTTRRGRRGETPVSLSRAGFPQKEVQHIGTNASLLMTSAGKEDRQGGQRKW